MKLYEITNMLAENENETDEKCYEDTKEILLEELNNKSSSIIKVFQNFKGNVDIIDQEIKRLQGLKQAINKQSERLKEYVTMAMQEAKLDKVETPLGKLSFRKSTSVEIEDESKIPAKYITIKQTESISKTDIGKDLKAGKEVAGAKLVTKKNLQIK